MGKPSRRPARELAKLGKKMRKELRKQQRAEGLLPPKTSTLPNGKSVFESVEEEQEARQQTVTEHFKVLRAQLPRLLRELKKIPDPRDPKKVDHQLTMVLLYGILTFVFHMSSRREANRKMTMPMFEKNLKLLIPGFEESPHHDTLYRLLRDLDDVGQIEDAHMALVKDLIRNKKFQPYLVNDSYPIVLDGTGKFTRSWNFDDEAVWRTVGTGEQKRRQYQVYTLEACLSFSNGIVIPLMTEFLATSKGDSERAKQDCELRAAERLMQRLKKHFPRLKIQLLLDGLYTTGPMMARCRDYGWKFMMVLQDKSLPSVWAEFKGLRTLSPENKHQQAWGDRKQLFTWVNGIEYTYRDNNGDTKEQCIHMVLCEETWKKVTESKTVEHHSHHCWISSEPLNSGNLHERCNLTARYRWGIEANILVEKHHGYQAEHCFSYNWQAMKGYHFMMRLGHLINVLARFTERLQETVQRLGVRGWLAFLYETLTANWLEPEVVSKLLSQRFQLRLI